jgi:hypothetical protein
LLSTTGSTQASDVGVFLMFWLLISFSVALARLPRGAAAILLAQPPPAGHPMVTPVFAAGAAASDGK